jgi:hypothetical protein
MPRSAKSAFTRVFNTLCDAQLIRGPWMMSGSRLCGAPPKRRRSVSGTRIVRLGATRNYDVLTTACSPVVEWNAFR